MFRKKLILTAMAVAAFSAAAQSSAHFGARITWDLTSPQYSTPVPEANNLYSNGSGVTVGAFYNIPVGLGGRLYFEPGLGLYYDTFSINDLMGGEEGLSAEVDGSVNSLGFRVPMAVGYRFDLVEDISVAPYTGPQLNFGLHSKGKVDLPGGQSLSTSLYGNGWHRMDAQWIFGVRVHYQDNWFGEIGGAVGMTNIMGGDQYKNQKLRRNMFNITVGYVF